MNVTPTTPANEKLQDLLHYTNEFNLAEAALLIAQNEYPHLATGHYLQRLDDLSDQVLRNLFDSEDKPNLVRSLNHVLFQIEGLSGNAENYADPRNSFLNDVLERKRGIPISLSVIYLEVGWRLGLPLQGVSFPGHFLVKLELPVEKSILVFDPFFAGQLLTQAHLLQRLEQFAPDAETDLAQALQTASRQDIVLRMLRNLQTIYQQQRQWTKLLPLLEQMLIVDPGYAPAWRDRGYVYQYLDCKHAALQDYQRYLQLLPTANDAEKIMRQIEYLKKQQPYFC